MSDVLHRAKRVARYDELRDAAGAVRPAWKPLADTLSAIGSEEFARRDAAAQAMLRDNGVTYNVYDEADGQTRLWQLDIMPFVIGRSDWSAIEAGIVQRARLTDTVLRDIYGPQKLIAQGHLPPHVVLGHPQFLRPLAGLTPPGGTHVHLYSADLTRMPDGSWMVLASRADAASGIGYALENRIVVAKTFPDLFAEMEVRRLASFFSQYREHVQSLAQSRRGRAVLLTPGPHNEAYFEHAYLAHYLGLTLVEGDDLAARDGRVFLKTLTGLERVAAIFRRVDSDFCDPLELRGDSALGVPGLVDAVRSGGVVLANALGGGVMESPAMDAYLPGLCRALLGEDLKIPDIPTVWCGTEWGAKEALARLDRVVVRDAFDARPLFSRHSSARLGSELSSGDIRVLKDRIARRGATVVTQGRRPARSRSDLSRRRVRHASRLAARLRGLDAGRLCRDAGRTGAHGERRSCPHAFDPVGRPEQGRLGPGPWACRQRQPAQAAGSPYRHPPNRRSAAKPGDGQSVLARPLQRARGMSRARPARRHRAPRRRPDGRGGQRGALPASPRAGQWRSSAGRRRRGASRRAACTASSAQIARRAAVHPSAGPPDGNGRRATDFLSIPGASSISSPIPPLPTPAVSRWRRR